MKMVDLMGAHFTKPLLASTVTHLICYKFEGEKYKLARQIPRIKLINHRWLEDCLKEWKILSEDKYSKSGWELEILAAEARDSEEETDNDAHTMLLEKQHISGSSVLQRGIVTPRNSKLATPITTVSGIPQDVEAVKGSSDMPAEVLVKHSLFSSPCKVANTVQSATLNDVKNKGLNEEFKYLSVGAQELVYNNDATGNNLVRETASIPRDKIIKHKKEGRQILSEARTVKRSPNSDVINDRRVSLCFSRKAPGKSTDTVTLEDLSSRSDGSPFAELAENKINDGVNTLPSNRNDLENGETQSPRSGEEELISVERQIDTMHDKIKESLNDSSSPKEKFLHKTEINVESSSRDDMSAKLDVNRLINDAPNIEVDPCPIDKTIPLTGVPVDSAADRQTEPPKNQSSGFKNKSLRRPTLRTRISDNTTSPSKNDLVSTGDTNYLGNIKSDKMKCPGYGEVLTNVERKSDILPEKNSVSEDGPYSPMEGDLRKGEGYHVESSPKTAKSAKLDLNCGKTDTANLKVNPCLVSKIGPLKGAALVNSVADRQTETQKNQSLGFRKKSLKSRPRTKIVKSTISPSSVSAENLLGDGEPRPVLGKQMLGTSLEGLEKSESALRPDHKDILLTESSKIIERTEPEKPCQTDEGEGAGKHKGMQDEKSTGEVTKKVLSKKNLSCRPKVTSGYIRKGNKIPCSDKAISRDQGTIYPEKPKDGEPDKTSSEENKTDFGFLTTTSDLVKEESTKGLPRTTIRMKRKTVAEDEIDSSLNAEKENLSIENSDKKVMFKKDGSGTAVTKSKKMSTQKNKVSNEAEVDASGAVKSSSVPRPELQWFILSGHHFQKKEFQQVIKRLRGRICRDSHHWSYQATHFIVPDPVRRTEKFFAAAASGRWILKTDYLTASNQAGRFLTEEPFEWHKSGLSEDGAINLEAPRKWRLLREKTGHGAFYGMRVVIYGECIAPTLDTLKRVVKAGDGTILATSPPYHRFLKSGVDFAIVSPGMPRVDLWVQEFLSHEIPCVLADYLVEYVCKPGYSLERHVLYKTHAWAEKSFANLLSRLEEIVELQIFSEENDDLVCQVCGSGDRGEVMLICGNDSGSLGCGVGIHIDCCEPPLEAVPQEDWFCSSCKSKSSSRSNNNSTNKKTKKGSSILKCR